MSPDQSSQGDRRGFIYQTSPHEVGGCQLSGPRSGGRRRGMTRPRHMRSPRQHVSSARLVSTSHLPASSARLFSTFLLHVSSARLVSTPRQHVSTARLVCTSRQHVSAACDYRASPLEAGGSPRRCSSGLRDLFLKVGGCLRGGGPRRTAASGPWCPDPRRAIPRLRFR